MGNTWVFLEDYWSELGQQQLGLACPRDEDVWNLRKQCMHVLTIHESCTRKWQGRTKALFIMARLFTQTLQKNNVVLVTDCFELPSIHEKAATSGLPILFLYLPWGMDFFWVMLCNRNLVTTWSDVLVHNETLPLNPTYSISLILSLCINTNWVLVA